MTLKRRRLDVVTTSRR